ncbi:MAG: acyl-CoA reductase [Planctomycetota bacterium]|jgi:hypothetical protein
MDQGITTGFLPRTKLSGVESEPLEGVDGVRVPTVTPELLGRIVIPFETFGGLEAASEPVAFERVVDACNELSARLSQDTELRRKLLRWLPVTTGFSAALVEEGLDRVARQFTAAQVRGMVEAELGGPAILEEFQETPGRPGVLRRARPPRLLLEWLPGNVFAAPATALLRAVALRGPALLKCAKQDPFTAPLLAAELESIDAEVVRAVAALYWKGADRDLEETALALAEVAVVHGDATTIGAMRSRMPPGCRVVVYGPRHSVGYVAVEALDTAAAAPGGLETLAGAFADDVLLYKQRGCLSVQEIYVEEGSDTGAEAFCRALADALDRAANRLDLHDEDPQRIFAVDRARRTHTMVEGSQLFTPEDGSATWTVSHLPPARGEDPPRIAWPGEGFVSVRWAPKGVARPALLTLAGDRDILQQVVLAAESPRREALAEELAAIGVPRICRPGRAQSPGAGWHQDGRPALGDLVSWTELER